MLTWEEDVEAAALRAQGWTIAAIARHLGRDPKTIRAYLNGDRAPGQRRSSRPDPFAPFADYAAARLAEDRHVWATALYEEVQALGYPGSYPSFTRALRSRGLRPHCEACAGVKGRETVDIDHPPGAEQQWDWADLPGAPWGGSAHVLVGALSYSSQARAVLSESQDLPHLVQALDGVLRRFGGTARRWRVDRMATVIDPLHDAAVVAHRPPGGRRRRPGVPGPLLGHHRRRPGAPRWPPSGWPHPAPAAPSDCRRMPPRWSGSSLPRSPLPGPASARPTGHPAPRHRRPPIS